MIKYLDSVIQELPEKVGMTAATLAAEHLFTVLDEVKTQYLPEDQAHTFHHTVSHLLLMSYRASQDIHTEVALLNKSVNKLD